MNTNETHLPGQSRTPPTTGRPDKPGRVLVVDDDRELRRFSATVLGATGYEVEVAEDGAVGWWALRAGAYDLLITDNEMPKMSGVELVSQMRSEALFIPVIMATGEVPTEELERRPELRIDATLLKPFSGEELLGIVRSVLGSRNRENQGPVRRREGSVGPESRL